MRSCVFFVRPKPHVTGDHFRRGETCSKAARDLSEWTISHARHRREHHVTS